MSLESGVFGERYRAEVQPSQLYCALITGGGYHSKKVKIVCGVRETFLREGRVSREFGVLLSALQPVKGLSCCLWGGLTALDHWLSPHQSVTEAGPAPKLRPLSCCFVYSWCNLLSDVTDFKEQLRARVPGWGQTVKGA